jgi:UDP-N-acetylmuramoyl-L-alanyl-D-glutamate--2,6-diaminopimelate ligase
VGCGGDRDKGKRPMMAKVASELSDRLILTSDNPRSENPEDILKEMRPGVLPHKLANTLTISDRKEAIRAAVQFCGTGDIILIAGKGHEKYQDIKGVKHPFDDKQILIETLTNAGK